MNPPLPPRDRGDRIGTARRQSRRGQVVSGAVGLVGGVEDSAKGADVPERDEAGRTLEASLCTILQHDPDNELNHLLLEMCEANQLEPLMHDGIRSWRRTRNNDFASRSDAIPDEIRAAIANLFLAGLLIFSVELGEPLDVRWVCTKREPVN